MEANFASPRINFSSNIYSRGPGKESQKKKVNEAHVAKTLNSIPRKLFKNQNLPSTSQISIGKLSFDLIPNVP